MLLPADAVGFGLPSAVIATLIQPAIQPAFLNGVTDVATGTVKWFNATKGYGFIQPDKGGKDVFVHISAVEKAGLSSLNEGAKVSYEIVSDRGEEGAGNLRDAGKAVSHDRRHRAADPGSEPSYQFAPLGRRDIRPPNITATFRTRRRNRAANPRGRPAALFSEIKDKENLVAFAESSVVRWSNYCAACVGRF